MPDSSDRRERKAARTRSEILDAARRLFEQKGFAGTTVADISTEADVAVQTIYSHLGSKSDLVLALVDDMDAAVGGREAAAAIASAPTAHDVLAASVGFTRRLQEEWGDVVAALHAAAPTDDSAATALEEGLRRHRAAGAAAARRLDELGALRDDVPADEAGQVIATLTSHETYRQLTRDHGWSYERCGRWLEDAIGRLLLRPTDRP